MVMMTTGQAEEVLGVEEVDGFMHRSVLGQRQHSAPPSPSSSFPSHAYFPSQAGQWGKAQGIVCPDIKFIAAENALDLILNPDWNVAWMHRDSINQWSNHASELTQKFGRSNYCTRPTNYTVSALF